VRAEIDRSEAARCWPAQVRSAAAGMLLAIVSSLSPPASGISVGGWALEQRWLFNLVCSLPADGRP
jgi:hypothetical protein